MANHPKPSAKNAQGEAQSKPFTWADFDRMAERAITTPARKPAPESKQKSGSPDPGDCTGNVFVQVGLQVFPTDRSGTPPDSPLCQTPESLNRLRVGVAHNVNVLLMLDALVDVSMSCIFVQPYTGYSSV